MARRGVARVTLPMMWTTRTESGSVLDKIRQFVSRSLMRSSWQHGPISGMGRDRGMPIDSPIWTIISI
jgi:hypothetical protein